MVDLKIRQDYLGAAEGYRYEVYEGNKYDGNFRFIGLLPDIPSDVERGTKVEISKEAYRVTSIYDSKVPNEEEVMWLELKKLEHKVDYDLGVPEIW